MQRIQNKQLVCLKNKKLTYKTQVSTVFLYLIVKPVLILQGAKVLQPQIVFIIRDHEACNRSRCQASPVSTHLCFNVHFTETDEKQTHREFFILLFFFLLLAFKALHFWYTWNTVQPWKLNRKKWFYNENDLSTYRGKITALTVLCTYLFKCFTVMIKAKPHNINKTNNTKTPWTAITL